MKGNSLFFALFFIISVTCQAQLDSIVKKQTFHGIVRNEKNKPIQNASVIVEGEEKGTITDSVGYFKINARPDAVLVINAEDYETSSVPVHKEELIRIVLKKNKSLDNKDNSIADQTIWQESASNDFRNYVNTESSKNYTGSFLPVFTLKENTVGNRYLFDSWVKGKLIDTNNKEINIYNYVFNYDKMTGKLIATPDKKIIIDINDEGIKSYSLTDPSGVEIKFEKNNLINKEKFVVQLISGKDKKYSLYKSINTKFIKANYVSNGLIESGKKYDEYADSFEYYVVFGGSNYKKVELKEKAIKQALTEQEEKVKAFFMKHRGDKLNEILFSELISTLNQ